MKRKTVWGAVLLLALAARAAWAAPATYALDPESSRLEFSGSTPLHGFTGATRELSARLVADTAADRIGESTPVRVPVAGLRTGNATRDHAVQHTLKAERHPDIVFTLESVSPSGSKEGARGAYRVKGTLEVGGRAVPVEFDAEAVFGDGEFTVSGSVPLTLPMFGLEPPGLARLMGLRDEVTVRFETHWKKAGA
jgi:polyisoprenoid-binding protein YceI